MTLKNHITIIYFLLFSIVSLRANSVETIQEEPFIQTETMIKETKLSTDNEEVVDINKHYKVQRESEI